MKKDTIINGRNRAVVLGAFVAKDNPEWIRFARQMAHINANFDEYSKHTADMTSWKGFCYTIGRGASSVLNMIDAYIYLLNVSKNETKFKLHTRVTLPNGKDYSTPIIGHRAAGLLKMTETEIRSLPDSPERTQMLRDFNKLLTNDLPDGEITFPSLCVFRHTSGLMRMMFANPRVSVSKSAPAAHQANTKVVIRALKTLSSKLSKKQMTTIKSALRQGGLNFGA